MNLDADEYWMENELQYAKNEIIKHGYDATIVKNIRYYKYPTVQTTYDFNDYAPCIYSIEQNLSNAPMKYAVDPSRKIRAKKLHVFKINEVVMHHYWMIRKNLDKKFRNKSSQGNFSKNLDETIKFYQKYNEGDDITFWRRGHKCECKANIVPNYFNIDIKI